MDLASLVAQQTHTGSLITRFLANFKKTSRSKLTFYVYEARLKLLEKYWSKFCDRHEEALVLSDFATSDYAKQEYFSKVEEAYIEAQAFITEQMAHLNSSKSTEREDVLPDTSHGAKMPKLNLPTFSGNYLEWVSFKDLFVSAVNNNKSLSNATRLQYLKAQLTGEAATLVSNIPITDANFATAWQTLTERYDNERIIVNHYYDHLLSLRPLTSESASNLRQLLDTTNETRRALENLNRPVDQGNDWLVHLTVKKLDSTTRKDWETSIGDKRHMPSWQDLSTFLTSRVHALEAVEPLDSTQRSSRNSSLKPDRRSPRSTVTSQHCVFCKENHNFRSCADFKQKSVSQRRDLVTQQGLCFNCLRDHPVSECQSAHRCNFCGAKHHSLLHSDHKAHTSTPSVSSSHAQGIQSTLLATAVVQVTGSNGKTSLARALLDQGSEVTFISEDLAQRLRLPRKRIHVPVTGMGVTHCGTVRALVQVQLSSVLGQASSVYVRAYVLPRLTKVFRPPRMDFNSWPHLRGLPLADTGTFPSSRVDLVIGADLYGTILLDGLIKGSPNSPVAQNTIFGWVLSGRLDKSHRGSSTMDLTSFHCSVDTLLSDEHRRFWEIEEGPSEQPLTPEEELCETHFQTTHTGASKLRGDLKSPLMAGGVANWSKSGSLQTPPDALKEDHSKPLQALHTVGNKSWSLQDRYSSLSRLLRVTAWIRRFGQNCRATSATRISGPLTTLELTSAQKVWICICQSEAFPSEIQALARNSSIPKGSTLLPLRPFLDSEGLLRVGGRLEHGVLGYEEKHPYIIPAKCSFSKLLVIDAHHHVLHGGPQLTLSHLSRRFWIIKGRRLVREVIHSCVRCARQAAKIDTPLMGQLPSSRVTPSRPFLHTGLDYAGPIQLRTTSGRGHKSYKGYIALFVCMATKAIHLEAVSNYTTSGFIAAFKRFCSRRGIPATISSDQATNFRGADADLRRLLQTASKENRQIAELLANDGTHWQFIPPHGPHFGGLWEAGIRSVKRHLRRTVGDRTLTFEELTTVLTEIEACLNSRPLTPLSSSPQDCTALTPGHFLIGTPLRTIPEPSQLEVAETHLSRWQLLRRLSEQFWHRWTREYLQQLQQRSKWRTTTENLKVNDLVLVAEDNLPPTKWCLGRITRIHPGPDGIVRVVTLRTATTELQRPVAKLCRLPVQP